MTVEKFTFDRVEYALDIYGGDQLVGRIGFEPETDRYSLQYARSWAKAMHGYAISPHLPMDREVDGHVIRRFLENLLPEGRALEVVCGNTKIQKNNVFGLVRHLGKETTGGLTYLPAGQRPRDLESRAREVTSSELQERIDQRNQVPFTLWDGRARMSIAGFQDKILVHQAHGRMFLPDGGLSSTHILKPEPTNTGLAHMVANEHYCMQLAARMSKQRYKQNHVAEVAILRVPSPVLTIKRFDRDRSLQTKEVDIVTESGESTGKVVGLDFMQRLHIIDGCQAGELSVTAKYERNLGNSADVRDIRDGASFARIFGIKNHLETPAVGIQRMVLWAATTLLFGNSDANGKNISFYVGKAGLNVGELYDLVNVMQYDATSIDHSMAMGFGDCFELEAVNAFDLATFCVRSGISRSYFARELENLCESALVHAPLQAKEGEYVGDEHISVGKIASFVSKRATFLKSIAKEINVFKNINF